MRASSLRKQENSLPAGTILVWMLVFLLGVVLIFGHVRYYELTLENQRKLEELQQLQKELSEQKKQQQQMILNLAQQAEVYGLYLPQPEEYIVVQVAPETD